MPDRIYDFQQVLIIQYIEDLSFLLVQAARNRRQIHELYRAIWGFTTEDSACPDRLKPSNYFGMAGKHWEDRVMIDEVRRWLIDLHKHYDEVGQSTAAR